MSTDDKLLQELREAQKEFKEQEELQAVSESQVESEPTESTTTEEASKYTEVEQEAMKQGWKPNYEGAGRKSAEEFIKDGSFFKKIAELKKDNDLIREAFKTMTSHQKKVEKAAYERGREALRQERDAAIEVGDVTKVHALDEHIQTHTQQIKALEDPVVSQEQKQDDSAQAAATDFISRNQDWYKPELLDKDVSSLSDEERTLRQMTEDARLLDELQAMKIANKQVSMTPSEALNAVETAIKSRYKQQFDKTNPNKEAAPVIVKSSVSGSSSESTSGLKLVSRLSERQKQVYKMYIAVDPKYGSLEDFAKQLDAIGDLKN